MQRIARETEERRERRSRHWRTDGGRAARAVVELDATTMARRRAHQRRGARGGARRRRGAFSSADADAAAQRRAVGAVEGKAIGSGAGSVRDARDASKGRKRGGGGGSARPSLPGSSKSQIALPNEQYRPDHPMPQPSSSREQELEFPLNMPMRDVKLGTWACTTGDDIVEVTWRKKSVKFLAGRAEPEHAYRRDARGLPGAPVPLPRHHEDRDRLPAPLHPAARAGSVRRQGRRRSLLAVRQSRSDDHVARDVVRRQRPRVHRQPQLPAQERAGAQVEAALFGTRRR